jgi:hypothetical protein
LGRHDSQDVHGVARSRMICRCSRATTTEGSVSRKCLAAITRGSRRARRTG